MSLYPDEMPNVMMYCSVCEKGQVIMTYKKYRKKYRGMCDNKECELWHTAWVSK